MLLISQYELFFFFFPHTFFIMASHLPNKKCCFKAHLHNGLAKGEFVEISNVECYVVGDKSSKKAIVMLTDAFGIRFQNNLLVADTMAANGYYVVVPDMFNGDSFLYPPPMDRIEKWLQAHTPDTVAPITDRVLTALKNNEKFEFELLAPQGIVLVANMSSDG